MISRAIPLALIALAAAWPLAGNAANEAEATFKREKAACMNGTSNQDRATCLKEANAAYAEMKRNNLQRTPRSERRANATDRCNAQPAADRADCVKRITAGQTKGSVAGGGIIRKTETTTLTPGKP